MNLKKQTTLIFILYCSLVCSQMPIHKIEKNCSKNINYKLQNKGSNITLNDSLGFIQKLQNEKTISNFVIKDRPQISVAITSLDIIRIKRGNLNFNKFKKSQYKPDIMLNEFIEKNISFESFINIDKKKTYKIGVYMFWDFQDSLQGIEFVEVKNNKYYLIYSYRLPR